MPTEEILKESFQGTLEISPQFDSKGEKFTGRLGYELSYDRFAGKPMTEGGKMRKNVATLILQKTDSEGVKKELIHYFEDQSYKKTRLSQKINAKGNFNHKVLNGFQIPKPVREYLVELNDPIVEMVIGKYIE